MRTVKSINCEKGQAILLVVVAASLFLFAALGLAIDSSQLYTQRQMAKAAADAAAQAAALSVRNGTNTAGKGNTFGSASLNCGSGAPPSLTPCYYAWLNGFSKDNGDAVKVDFPTTVSGVSDLVSTTTPAAISVTVTRPVKTTLMALLGISSGNVVGHATAALVGPVASVPIVFTGTNIGDAFDQDNSTIVVNGGPSTSIQVNSCAGAGVVGCTTSNKCACALTAHGGATLDLSKAGPTGTGGILGSYGPLDSGSPAPSTWLNPGTGFKHPQSPVPDPLKDLSVPVTTGRPVMTAGAANTTAAKPNPCIVKKAAPLNACQTAAGANWTFTGLGCDKTPDGLANAGTTCTLYFPGVYDTTNFPHGIAPTGWTVFAPGVYYIQAGKVGSTPGGLISATGTINHIQMAAGFPASTETGVGALFYNASPTGIFDLSGSNGADTVYLTGDTTGNWSYVLFFENRNITGAPLVHAANPQGTASITNLTGILYLSMGTNSSEAKYNKITISGVGTTNVFNGGVIVDAALTGGPGSKNKIIFNLSRWGRPVTQIALVE
jgi:hypothetical protein